MSLCAAGIFFSSALRAQTSDGTGDLADLKKMSLEQLLQVEVTTASRTPEKLEDTASAIQVISGEDIRRSGATTLADALRLASNLEVDQKNSHDWGISARGFNTDLSNKLLVMIDGRSIYTPLFSGVRWDSQNYLLADIDRIEVVSGPGATLWGANAVNGVINIISKSARDTQGLYVESEVGTEDRSGYGVRFGGMIGQNVAYRIYDTYMDFGSLKFNNGQNAGDAWSMHQSGFRIDGGATS
ncbi:MAG TPA: TonB-dependent receptor plug domain-containing protein, partial [Opitutaceae bacterium]